MGVENLVKLAPFKGNKPLDDEDKLLLQMLGAFVLDPHFRNEVRHARKSGLLIHVEGFEKLSSNHLECFHKIVMKLESADFSSLDQTDSTKASTFLCCGGHICR